MHCTTVSKNRQLIHRQLIQKSSYGLPTDFKNKRVPKKKTMFDYEGKGKTYKVCLKASIKLISQNTIDSVLSNMESRLAFNRLNENQHY